MEGEDTESTSESCQGSVSSSTLRTCYVGVGMTTERGHSRGWDCGRNQANRKGHMECRGLGDGWLCLVSSAEAAERQGDSGLRDQEVDRVEEANRVNEVVVPGQWCFATVFHICATFYLYE